MTKGEITGKRSLAFSEWARKNLKDSKEGLIWTDVDCLLEDYKKKCLMLVEVKMNNSPILFPQTEQLEHLHQCLQIGAKQIGYDYWGFFVVKFNKDNPEDSDFITINGMPITKQQLIDHLSFTKRITITRLI